MLALTTREYVRFRNLFDPGDEMFRVVLNQCIPAWSSLILIPEVIVDCSFKACLSKYEYFPLPERFKKAKGWFGTGTEFDEENVTIQGPVFIGAHCKILSGAKIHGGCIIGHGCHIGGEVENSILFRTKAKHSSFIGHSIVSDSNIAAGVVFADLCCDERTVRLNLEGATVDTGLRKFGSIVRGSKINSNATLNPGTVLSPGVIVDPNVPVRGFVPPNYRARFASNAVGYAPIRSMRCDNLTNGGR